MYEKSHLELKEGYRKSYKNPHDRFLIIDKTSAWCRSLSHCSCIEV